MDGFHPFYGIYLPTVVIFLICVPKDFNGSLVLFL